MPLSATRMMTTWLGVRVSGPTQEAVAPQGVPPQSSLQASSAPPQLEYTERTVSIAEVQVSSASVPPVGPAVNAYQTSRLAAPPGSHEAAPSFVARLVLP